MDPMSLVFSVAYTGRSLSKKLSRWSWRRLCSPLRTRTPIRYMRCFTKSVSSDGLFTEHSVRISSCSGPGMAAPVADFPPRGAGSDGKLWFGLGFEWYCFGYSWGGFVMDGMGVVFVVHHHSSIHPPQRKFKYWRFYSP